MSIPQTPEEYEAYVLSEIDEAALAGCPVACHPCIIFESYSNGRGRRRRRHPRTVKFFKYYKRVLVVRDTPRDPLDKVAEKEVLVDVDIPPHRNPYDEFVLRFEMGARQQSQRRRRRSN